MEALGGHTHGGLDTQEVRGQQPALGYGTAAPPAGTHSGQRFLDILPGSGNVPEDCARSVFL